MLPELDAWDAWHPRVVAGRLAGLDRPWCVVGGWALDLFRDEVSRAHADLEIAAPAGRFAEVAARFPECDLYIPAGGEVAPVSEEGLREEHQTWLRERATGRWRLDVFREPHDGDTWICRRDERIRRPYAEIVERTPDGIPYLAPEFVLLFKAKEPRDKDVADLRGALPRLDAGRRDRLREMLTLVHPDHPWLALLT